ncbi:MAG TPA: GTP-binding protein [Anaerolineae bacterium]|nr:GTP-binding protein [Anaerolineae bacterium]
MAKAAVLPAAIRLPATLAEIRRLFDAFDWTSMAHQVEEETLTHVAIVGPVNSGKSTLFNFLKGHDISPVGAVPGTTRTLLNEQWGPFTLVDTPGFGEVDGVDRAGTALSGIDSANVIVLVLDAGAGVRQTDFALLHRLRATNKPVIAVLNKIDLLGKEWGAVLEHARTTLNEPNLIPISAKKGTNIAELLLPRVVDAHPALAVSIGRAIPAYRRHACVKVIRAAAAINAVVGLEPVPGLDIPFLLASQARMVLRIAAIYGEPMSTQHAKELIATIAGGVALRYLGQEGAKLLPAAGWVVAAGVAAAGTYAMGQVAVQYFEHNKTLTPEQMQALYRRKRRRRERELAKGEE